MDNWHKVALWRKYYDEINIDDEANIKDTSWESFYLWRDSAKPLIESIKTSIKEKLELNKQLYKQYVDDLEEIDWVNFRPLRLSREEDYSDWLCHFMGTSTSSYFLNQCLGLNKVVRVIKAEREIGSEGYRSDIMLTLSDGTYIHIEVKIGDDSMQKTYNTAIAMQRLYNTTKEKLLNYILLMPEQLADWEDVEDPKWEFRIRSLTWEQIAIAGRNSVYYSAENTLWKTWMLGFVGAIEAELLRIPSGSKVEISNMREYNKKLRILSESLIKSSN